MLHKSKKIISGDPFYGTTGRGGGPPGHPAGAQVVGLVPATLAVAYGISGFWGSWGAGGPQIGLPGSPPGPRAGPQRSFVTRWGGGPLGGQVNPICLRQASAQVQLQVHLAHLGSGKRLKAACSVGQVDLQLHLGACLSDESRQFFGES